MIHAFALSTVILLALPATGLARERSERADAALDRALSAIARSQTGKALEELDRLVAAHPNFRVAHLVRGDLLLARSGRTTSTATGKQIAPERVEELRAEALARLRAHREAPPRDAHPRPLIEIAPNVRHVVLVDASRWRVYLYENTESGPKLAADYYASLGKRGIGKIMEGDRKTPLGVYHIVSSIPGAKLPDLYGWGALPINYPNAWDRLSGKTGHGIWLHGVPADTYSRPPWASDGCIALANVDIRDLASRIDVGTTPVIIVARLDWIAPGIARAERAAFLHRLNAWRADWASRDARRYLAHYARSFRSASMDRAAWEAHKRSVNATKSWIDVRLDEVSVFANPEEGLIAVTFEQDYRSSNLSQRTRKRQYWIRESGEWKIAYEGSAQSDAVALPESFPGSLK